MRDAPRAASPHEHERPPRADVRRADVERRHRAVDAKGLDGQLLGGETQRTVGALALEQRPERGDDRRLAGDLRPRVGHRQKGRRIIGQQIAHRLEVEAVEGGHELRHRLLRPAQRRGGAGEDEQRGEDGGPHSADYRRIARIFPGAAGETLIVTTCSRIADAVTNCTRT
ncbi:MAG TPA: hypothetical protein VJ276_11885 [Thermoanaerobaculia bacterium]|nr:hypothetical protein [Thermoanaerobaculia bacterium]